MVHCVLIINIIIRYSICKEHVTVYSVEQFTTGISILQTFKQVVLYYGWLLLGNAGKYKKIVYVDDFKCMKYFMCILYPYVLIFQYNWEWGRKVPELHWSTQRMYEKDGI